MTTSTDDSVAHRRRLLQRAAWLCALLVLVVTSLSAFLRQSGADLGCRPWPACHARAASADAAPVPPTAAVQAARGTHRVVASSLLVLLVGMVVFAYRGPRSLVRERRVLLLALGLVLFLAVLGVFTAGARLPAVTLGNLLAGLLLFATFVYVAERPRAMAEAQRLRLRRWAWLGAALLAVQAGLGALVSAGYAGLSCPQLLACTPGPDGWAALNPWQVPGPHAGEAGFAGGVGVQLLHRLATFAVVGALGILAAAAWRAGQRGAGAAILGLAALQAELGIALVLAQLPMGVALAHNLVAALMLGTAAALAARAAPLSPGF